MSFANLSKFFVIPAAAFVVGASAAISCISVDYPTVAFRCNPRLTDACPEGFTCCSDDPSAQSDDPATPTANGNLPAYLNRVNEATPGFGVPLFSGLNNTRGTSGMCVDTGRVGAGAGLFENGCPVPCNPTWEPGEVQAVCGAGTMCCQTVELTADDCVFDQAVNGGAGGYRPLNGADAVSGSPPGSTWTPGGTKQDANGFRGCTEFATDPVTGMVNGTILLDCANQLTVANQRGFCLGGDPTRVCLPSQPQPGYLDACQQLTLCFQQGIPVDQCIGSGGGGGGTSTGTTGTTG